VNYHLHSEGKDLGEFSIEVLSRRRMLGELTGIEYVWREGMADWQPIDSVLQQNPSFPGKGPPPIPTKKRISNARLVMIVAFIVIGTLATLVFSGVFVVKGIREGMKTRRTGSESVPDRSGPYSGQSDAIIANKPITWTTNTLTWVDVRKRSRAFRIRQYLDGYKQFGNRNTATDADSLRLIESWITYHFGEVHEQTNITFLEELSGQLAFNANCNDGLVLTVAALNSVDLSEKIRCCERAVDSFANSKHKAYPKFYATITLAERIQTDRQARLPSLDVSAVRLFREAFKDGSFLPEDQREIADLLLNGWGNDFLERNGPAVVSVAKEAGREFEWLALVLEGQSEITEAWRARGGSSASKVTEQGWKGFNRHLGNARRSLSRAWELRPDLPMAPGRMITVAMADSGMGELRLWFDRAVEAQLDYFPAWRDLRWGLRPRWGGSLESMRAIGIGAINTERFDTDVPRMFFDVVIDLEAEVGTRGGRLFGREDIWPHMQKMYEGYIAEPTRAYERDGWRSAYTVVSYLAGKYDVASQQLTALDWKPLKRNLSGWGCDMSLLPSEVAARNSPFGREISEAESHHDRGDITSAFRDYARLKGRGITDPRAVAFIDDRLRTLETERKLLLGESVPFLPIEDSMRGWQVERGDFKRLPDGALEVKSGQQGHLIYSRTRVGKRFEVTGEFDVMRSTSKAFQAGLVIGLPQVEHTTWTSFRMKLNDSDEQTGVYGHGWSSHQISENARLQPRGNTFQFQFVAGTVTAVVNGQPVLSGTKLDRNYYFPTNEIYLGLGALNDMNETTLRYRNVKVRKL
jgi:hypothetical protein